MALRVMACLLMLNLFACNGDYKQAYAVYQAPFDPHLERVNAVALFVHDLAVERDLYAKESDREETKFITSGIDAFEILLRQNGDRVMLVSNASIGTKLLLKLYEPEHMAVEELNRLADEFKDALEDQFGLEFCPVDLRTQLCKE